MHMMNKYIVEDIKYDPGHVIPSWSTSPMFAAPGLENYCQESSEIHETTVNIVSQYMKLETTVKIVS